MKQKYIYCRHQCWGAGAGSWDFLEGAGAEAGKNLL